MKDQKSFVVSASGVKIPKIIYGTAWKKDKTCELVTQAMQMGFRGVDTACQPKHYNEAEVGAAIASLIQEGSLRREEIFIQTKFTPLGGQDPLRIPYDPHASLTEQVLQSWNVSRKNLHSKFVDSWVLHSPLGDHQQLMKVWSAMEEVQRRGEAKILGISNCYSLQVLQKLYQAAEIKPQVLQNRFYQETGYDRDLRDWCKDKGIIYQGFWTLSANPHLLKSKIVQDLANFLGKTPAQILYRFLIHIDVFPLIGTTSVLHMKEDVQVFDFELPVEDIARLNNLLLH